MSDLGEIIARLEKATRGSRELDATIHDARSTRSQAYHDFRGCRSRDETDKETWAAFCKLRSPRYTSSLDAALTLVPEGHWWEIGKVQEPTSPMRHFGSGRIYMASAGGYGENHRNGHSDTPAIALCIAALKARQSLGVEGKSK